MATNSSHLMCPTCLQEYSSIINTPILLPCLHSICRHCLEKLMENLTASEKNVYQFQCPVCMKIVTKPSDLPVEKWAGHLPVNAVLQSLLPKTKTKVDQLCDPCLYVNTSIAATSYCTTCKEALCELCDSAHHKSRASREHTVLKLDEIADPSIAVSLSVSITCTYHSNIDMNFYCTSHDSICCSDCIIDYHRGCNDKLKLRQLADKLFQAKEPVRTMERLKQLESHLDKYTAASNENLQVLETSTKDMTAEIDKLISTLNEAKSKIAMERECLLEDESRKRCNETQKCQSLKATLRDSLILLDTAVKYGNRHQSFVILHKIKEQLAYCEKTIHDKYSQVRQVETRLQLNEHFISLRKLTESQIAKIEITENKLKKCLPVQNNYAVTSDSIQAMTDEELPSISTMPYDLDVELLLVKVKERPLEGQNIQVVTVPVTSSIQLSRLPLSITKDAVELYFENPKLSGGGPVADVKLAREKQSCIVSFKHSEDAERVCMRQHTIDKKEIQVCLYYECLDDDLHAEEFSDIIHETEDTVDELKLPDPIKLNDWNPQILRFLIINGKHRNMFEKNLSDVNGVAKWPSSAEGYVIIECTMKVEDKNVSSLLKDWTTRVINKVNNFAAGIEVAEFILIQIAWPRVLEGLQTVTIENPEDVVVFVDEEKHNIAVAGPRAIVEELKHTIKQMIVMVETKIALEKNTVRETKKLKTFEIALLRMSHFNQDIKKMHPELQFDLDQKERMAIFVGQADIVQKVIVQMHEKLNSFVSRSMQISKAAKDLLFAQETRKYINQKMFSQKIVGVWDVVRHKEVLMFGQDEREVRKAIQLVNTCLVENKIPLEEAMAQAIQGQQWSQLVQCILKKHTGKCAIEPDIKGILVVAVDDIFQDVFNEIKVYLEKHSVEELFLVLDPMRVKFIRRYKNEDIKALEKRFESPHVKLSIIDYGDKKGIKINGTRDVCSVVKTELAKMANTVITKEHRMVRYKEGLKEFLQGYKVRDQLSTIEKRFKCFMVMKDSGTSSSLQQEGASGGFSRGSENCSCQNYEPMERQSSPESAGSSIDAQGRIRVSLVEGELVKQRAFTKVLGGTTVPSTSTRSASSSSNISTVSGKCRCTLPHSVVLEMVKGNITKETTCVIVNSVLSGWDLSQGEVSKAILKAGGISIQQECQNKYQDFKKHGYIVTNSGILPCKIIIHMAAQDDDHKWKEMIRRVLCEANQSKWWSISFPALGTGGKGLSPEKIAQAMYSACIEFAKSRPDNLKQVRVVLFEETMLTRFVQAVSVHSSGQGESQVSRTPVGETKFRSGSKQSSLVFNITADSDYSVQAAVNELEGFVNKEFFI